MYILINRLGIFLLDGHLTIKIWVFRFNEKDYRETYICASLFFQAIMNFFIQVIFPNIIKYLDRTFKEEQNKINFNFIYQVSDAKKAHKNAKMHHA